MIGRRAVLGLSLLSALVFCAFAAQGATAAEKESENTTAYTCVKSINNDGDFKDEHCDETGPSPGKEIYRHDVIEIGKTTNIGGDNEKVTESTKKLESAVLKGKLGLVETEITCEKYVVDETKSWIRNVESGKSHKVEGTVRAEFKTCTVKKPAKCTVKEPIEVNANFVGVDGLRDPETGKETAMGLRFTGEKEFGTSKDVFASITYEGIECSLKGQTFPITGSAIATSGPNTSMGQSVRESGATLVFQPESGKEKVPMQALHLGEPKNVAKFETISTSRMAEKGNPISLTTPTP